MWFAHGERPTQEALNRAVTAISRYLGDQLRRDGTLSPGKRRLRQRIVQGMRRHGLCEQLQQARPKRLRLWVLCRAGQIIHHARSLMVRVIWRARRLMGRIAAARRKLMQLAWRVLQWERARASPRSG